MTIDLLWLLQRARHFLDAGVLSMYMYTVNKGRDGLFLRWDPIKHRKFGDQIAWWLTTQRRDDNRAHDKDQDSFLIK